MSSQGDKNCKICSEKYHDYQCFECNDYFHSACTPKKVLVDQHLLFGRLNYCQPASNSYSHHYDYDDYNRSNNFICGQTCLQKFEKIKKLFQLQTGLLVEKFELLFRSLEDEKQKNGILKNSVEELKETVEELKETVNDVQGSLEYENQQKLRTHIAISGIPVDVTSPDVFFKNLLFYLKIDQPVRYTSTYFDKSQDAPRNQRSQAVFVLATENMKNLLMNACKKVRSITYGGMTPGVGKRNRLYHQKIIVREKLTEYMASHLKEARKRVSAGEFLKAEFNNGYVDLTTKKGNTFETNTKMDFDNYYESSESENEYEYN